jgi:hypothetical protein
MPSLRDALLATFGNKPFDTTSVILAAKRDAQLADAIEATVPPSKRRRGCCYNNGTVRRALETMAQQHFNTDVCGFWTVKQPAKP